MMTAMSDFAWEPETYLQLMSEEVPDYPQLQRELVRATTDGTVGGPRNVGSILDLGIGSGVTARLVLAAHPEAQLVGIDASAEMLAGAAQNLDPDRTRLLVGRLEDDLPEGPFDLVISSLAVHHLDDRGKADLFRRIHAVLAPGGRFVLADLIDPSDADDVVTPIDWIDDTPSTIEDQLHWLRGARLTPHLTWLHRDLAVVTGTRA